MSKLTFYSNYLSNIAQSPNKNWRDTQKEIIGEMFDNSTIAYYDIYEEGYPFDFKFVNNPPCWVSTVLDITTGIVKDSDDYRSLYFKDTTHEVGRGRYFKWNENYWMVYETTTQELESIATCNIRRCNNWLRWVTDKGELMEYPCVIENELTSTNAQVAKTITQANSHINVIVQGNLNTLKIGKNQRFLINGQPFKFLSVNNYAQTDFAQEDAPMLFMNLFLDMSIDEDNISDNIADDIRAQFKVETDVKQITNTVGYNGVLNTKVYHDNKLLENVQMEFISTNTDVVTIDEDGTYHLIDNGSAVIIAQIKGNPMSAVSIPISVTSDILDQYYIVVTPNVTYIKQGREITLTAKVVNSINTDMNVSVSLSASGDDKCYILTQIDDNVWKIKNIQMSNIPLTLVFTNTDYSLTYSIDIELKAMF